MPWYWRRLSQWWPPQTASAPSSSARETEPTGRSTDRRFPTPTKPPNHHDKPITTSGPLSKVFNQHVCQKKNWPSCLFFVGGPKFGWKNLGNKNSRKNDGKNSAPLESWPLELGASDFSKAVLNTWPLPRLPPWKTQRWGRGWRVHPVQPVNLHVSSPLEHFQGATCFSCKFLGWISTCGVMMNIS